MNTKTKFFAALTQKVKGKWRYSDPAAKSGRDGRRIMMFTCACLAASAVLCFATDLAAAQSNIFDTRSGTFTGPNKSSWANVPIPGERVPLPPTRPAALPGAASLLEWKVKPQPIKLFHKGIESGFKFGGETVSAEINQAVADAGKTIAGTLGLGGIPLLGVTAATGALADAAGMVKTTSETFTSTFQIGAVAGGQSAADIIANAAPAAGTANMATPPPM